MAYHVPFAVSSLSYQEALEALHATMRFGIVPLVETVEDMLEELGRPERAYACVQVAGTNGKTSTARYAAAMLAGEGRSVALYTSPELVSYTERMEVRGVPVTERTFAHAVTCALAAARHVNERRRGAGERAYDVTEFDLLTVAALVAFAEAGVDVAVLEVGLGGRWDATSAACSIGTVAVTGVGLDHTRILGDTVEKIAAEKAQVIKGGRSCVLGPGCAVPETVEGVFLARCRDVGVTPVLVRPEDAADIPGMTGEGGKRRRVRERPELPLVRYRIEQRPRRLGEELGLTVATPRATYGDVRVARPSYQAANVATAIALAEEALGRALDAGRMRKAVAGCPTPGRFDLLGACPPVVVDACHNPQSVSVFLEAVREVTPKRAERPTLVCAILADKDADAMVRLLAPEFERVIVTQTSSPRALPTADLAALFERHGRIPMAVTASVEESLALLGDHACVACGSITLAGELVGLLRTSSPCGGTSAIAHDEGLLR